MLCSDQDKMLRLFRVWGLSVQGSGLGFGLWGTTELLLPLVVALAVLLWSLLLLLLTSIANILMVIRAPCYYKFSTVETDRIIQ